MQWMMPLYNCPNYLLDCYTSVYNRPYDDQTQSKIYLETQAIFIIFNLIHNQKIQTISSPVLNYENSEHPFLKRYATEQKNSKPMELKQ